MTTRQLPWRKAAVIAALAAACAAGAGLRAQNAPKPSVCAEQFDIVIERAKTQ